MSQKTLRPAQVFYLQRFEHLTTSELDHVVQLICLHNARVVEVFRRPGRRTSPNTLRPGRSSTYQKGRIEDDTA